MSAHTVENSLVVTEAPARRNYPLSTRSHQISSQIGGRRHSMPMYKRLALEFELNQQNSLLEQKKLAL